MKFSSKPIAEHNETPLADDGQLEKIVSYWQQHGKLFNTVPESSKNIEKDSKKNQCYIVSIVAPQDPHPEGKLTEIQGLVKVRGDIIVGYETYSLHHINPKTYLGRGITQQITERANQAGANMIVLDAQLSPSQMRNLENITGIAICDREAVILNVFLTHAKTRVARNQVEIAHLKYLRPRIRGLGLNMDQQAGGVMGSRGPGETASELLARRLDNRLTQLIKSSQKLKKSSDNQRKSRKHCKRISLLGYTNAGKTSIMNALTSADLSVRDIPFETLDTTTRALTRSNAADILISDTVGFIRNLPKHLLTSFESTLAEAIEADLLLIVVDNTDPEKELHLQTTHDILKKLNADKIERLYLFNKCDRLNSPLPSTHYNLLSEGHDYITLNSFDKNAITNLHNTLINKVSKQQKTIKLFVPYSNTSIIKQLYSQCQVINVQPNDNGNLYTLRGEAQTLARIQHHSEDKQQ